jgi:hypothetical protein
MNALGKIKTNVKGYYRKFYRYQLIVGLLFSCTLLLSTFLFFSFTEYYSRLGSKFRLILLSLFIIGGISLVIWKVLLPALKLLGWKKGLSEEDMAVHIGQHFKGSIDDQLLNLLQLENSQNNNSLANAAIEQKAQKIYTYDFKQAISKNIIIHWLKLFCIPVGFAMLTIIWNPSIIQEGSNRIISFNESFSPPNPYHFKFINDNLTATDNQPFLLEIEFYGSVVPNTVFVQKNGKSYRMSENNGRFVFNFGSIENEEHFVLQMGQHSSKEYTIDVIHNPSIFNWTGTIQPPQYTNKDSQTIQNQAEFSCPEGSVLKINGQVFYAQKLSLIKMGTSNDTVEDILESGARLQISKDAKKLRLLAKQENSPLFDASDIGINVILDEYPKIAVNEIADSTLPTMHFFSGAASDDYGVKKVTFVAELEDSTISLPINTSGSFFDKNFHFSVDFSDISANSFQYYFVAWDNDGVNGSKSSKTEKRFYSVLNDNQKDSLINASNQAIESRMEQALQKALQQKEKLKSIQNNLKEKDQMSWQDKQNINEYLKDQKNLQKEVETLQQMKKKQKLQDEKYKNKNEELEEKKKAIDDLFEDLMDEETKKMMEELEKLMEKLADKQTIQEQLNEMEMSNEQIEEQLDRTLELFKQLEVEQMLDESIEKLEKLAEEQMKLSEEKNSEESQQKQDKLNQDFKNLQKSFEEMREKNKALQNPKKIDDTSKKEQSIQNKMQDASENMKQGKDKKGQENQKDAGQQMKSLGSEMQQMQQSMQQKEQSENINTLRQILENLIYLSLEQEKLLEKFKNISRFDPTFPALTQEQKKLVDDAQVIEDSLNALAKRQPIIAPMVHDELRNMKENMNDALSELGERQSFQAVVNQQRVMQSANTLALLLDEALQQMQNQMMQQQFGQNSCNKPGGNPKPGQSMQQLKQMLSKQLQQMKQMMEEGGEQKGKDGKDGKDGEGQSKDFAKMAAQQAAMKEKLKQLQKELQKNGGGLGDGHSLEKDLEEIEEKLYNKELNSELIERQERILTRMLEAEKSINEREFEEKRTSNSGNNDKKRNLLQYDTYESVDENGVELLETAPQHFKLYYRTKVSKYFNNFD